MSGPKVLETPGKVGDGWDRFQEQSSNSPFCFPTYKNSQKIPTSKSARVRSKVGSMEPPLNTTAFCLFVVFSLYLIRHHIDVT